MITDLRINEKGELEGKVEMPQWDEMYTKDQVVDMLKDLKTEIDIMSDSVVEGRTVTITSWKGMQERICKLIQSKIDKLKEVKDAI